MAVALYAPLMRRGAPQRWPRSRLHRYCSMSHQIDMEQSIMSDVLFGTHRGGLAILLWEALPRPWMLAGAGLAPRSSATVRKLGEIHPLPAVAYLLVAVRGGCRLRLGRRLRLLGAAFVLLILRLLHHLVPGHRSLQAGRPGHQRALRPESALADESSRPCNLPTSGCCARRGRTPSVWYRPARAQSPGCCCGASGCHGRTPRRSRPIPPCCCSCRTRPALSPRDWPGCSEAVRPDPGHQPGDTQLRSAVPRDPPTST